MRPWQYILTTLYFVLVAGYIGVTMYLSRAERAQLGCKGVEVVICDSLQRSFISVAAVEKAISKDYGVLVGTVVDKVDLCKIEEIVEGKSVVKNSEAYITPDGVLHVDVAQRDPVLRLDIGDGLYACDRTGFLFSIPASSSSTATLVAGKIPLHLHEGFSGRPTDPDQAKWVDNVLTINTLSKKSKLWESIVIVGQKNGDIFIKPSNEELTFNLGSPTELQSKFDRIKKYYNTIVPNVDKDYTSVSVKYRGQIVCR